MVHAEAGGRAGVGYTYSDASNAALINRKLAPLLRNRDAFNVSGALRDMQREVCSFVSLTF